MYIRRNILAFGLVELLLIVALAFGTGFAQAPNGEVLCGDLDEADCEILVNSQETMSTVESMSFDSEGQFTVNVDGLAITVEMLMDGSYAADTGALMSMMGTNSEMMDMLDNPEAMAEMMNMYGEVLNAVTADVNMSVALPAFLLGPDVPGELTMQMIAEDGIFYLYAVDPETDEGEWIGLDVSNFGEEYAQLIEEAMSEMDSEDMSMEDMMGIYDSEFFTLMQDSEFWNSYVSVTRLSDEDVDGQAMAVFITEYDYASALSDERFSAALQDYINTIFSLMEEDMAMDESDMTPEDVAGFFSDLTQTLLGNMEMQQVVWIGLDDGYVYHSEMFYTIEIDMEALATIIEEFSGEPVDMSEMGFRTMTLSVTFMTDASNFNEPVEVEAPEGVEIIDIFEEMMSDMDMGMMNG